jgi:hypothetical protein
LKGLDLPHLDRHGRIDLTTENSEEPDYRRASGQVKIDGNNFELTIDTP